MLLIKDWIFGFAGVTCAFLISVLLVDPLNSKARSEEAKKEDRNKEPEISGVETRAVVDSRIYERPYFFSAYPLSSFLKVWEANMKVYFPSDMKEKT